MDRIRVLTVCNQEDSNLLQQHANSKFELLRIQDLQTWGTFDIIFISDEKSEYLEQQDIDIPKVFLIEDYQNAVTGIKEQDVCLVRRHISQFSLEFIVFYILKWRKLDKEVSSVVHDLRSPLNSLIGFVEMLQMECAGPLNNQQQEYLNDIMDSAEELTNKINEIPKIIKS